MKNIFNQITNKLGIQSKKKTRRTPSSDTIKKQQATNIKPLSSDIINNYVRSVGRPTKYTPEKCNQIIELMSQGKSIEVASIEMGIHVTNLYQWVKIHQEFRYALKIARQLCERWWMEQGRKNIANKNFNHILWMMNMSNRFNWLTSKSKKEITSKMMKTYDIKVKPDDEKAAEILDILFESGAIKSQAKGDAVTEVN